MNNKKDLIRALRCKSVSEKCACLKCPYLEKIPAVGCVYSRFICHRERARDIAADVIESLEAENAVLREQLAEKEIELQTIRNTANQFKQWFQEATAERDALRAQPEQPNEPLTLEELREMDGEPVYDYMGQSWHVIEEVEQVNDFLSIIHMTDLVEFDYDTTGDSYLPRLYRRKPEQEEM